MKIKFYLLLQVLFMCSLMVYGEQVSSLKFLFQIRRAADYFAMHYSNATALRYTEDSCFISLPSHSLKRIKEYESRLLQPDSINVKSKYIVKKSEGDSPLPGLNFEFKFESRDGFFALPQRRLVSMGAGCAAPVTNKTFYISVIEDRTSGSENQQLSFKNKYGKKGFLSVGENSNVPSVELIDNQSTDVNFVNQNNGMSQDAMNLKNTNGSFEFYSSSVEDEVDLEVRAYGNDVLNVWSQADEPHYDENNIFGDNSYPIDNVPGDKQD